MSRPTQAVIDLAALRHNYQLACSLAPSSKTLAVVKANAYGHGSVQAAKTLEPLAPALAVACIEEAIELRDAGIKKPILLLEGPFSFGEVQIASELDFWLMVENHNHLAFIEESIRQKALSKSIRCWLKLDTGMHRLGFLPHELASVHQRLVDFDAVQKPVVVSTHFASADDPKSDFTPQQIKVFNDATAGLNCESSLCNSAGIMGWPEAHGNWNRPGFMMYGASPFIEAQEHADKLQPVMTLKSKVISVRSVEKGDTVGYGRTWKAERDSQIATVTVGYGDGYPRHAPSGTPILVNGKRCTLVGRVSMDMVTVDVTDIGPVNIGADVECWGKHLSINEVADYIGTIGYELMTRMPARVPRVYINAS